VLDGAIIFAPANELVPGVERCAGRRAGAAGVHMSTIPAMDYSLLY
jgi:hypothetical protein